MTELTASDYFKLPWYRRNLGAILLFLFFWPGLVLVCATGPVYYVNSKQQVIPYGKGWKVVSISLIALATAWFALAAWQDFSQYQMERVEADATNVFNEKFASKFNALGAGLHVHATKTKAIHTHGDQYHAFITINVNGQTEDVQANVTHDGRMVFVQFPNEKVLLETIFMMVAKSRDEFPAPRPKDYQAD